MKKLAILLLALSTSLFAVDVYATFNIEPNMGSSLSVDAKGIVKEINVKVGDRVKKGDVLLSLENSDLLASKATSEADLASLNVELDNANKSLDRMKKVQEVIDQEQFDSYQYKTNLIQSKIDASKANLAYKEALIQKSILKAPFNGVISGKFVEVGESPNGKCFELNDTSRVKLVLTFDEKYWGSVKVGNSFEYQVDGLDKKLIGRIAKVYPSADSKTRTVKAEVYTSGLMAGLFGDGFIKVK
jgi:RND family efflux transporter MFP subunit